VSRRSWGGVVLDPHYRQLFFREASRRLDEMEQVLASGGGPDFVALMRGLHTLKGMAATMGAAPMVMVAHAAEDLCARGQAESGAWVEDAQALLLEGVDRLRMQVKAASEGHEPAAGDGYEQRVRAVLRTGATFAFRLVQDMEADPRPAALGESVRALGGAQAAIAEALAATRRLRQVSSGTAGAELGRVEAALRRVYDELVPLREVAFGTVVPALRRHVRGVAERTGKLAHLAVSGEDLRVDGTLLSRLMGPLSALVSNAVVHGVEDEGVRLAAGKRRAGQVTVSVERVGRSLVVRVDDDGAGFSGPDDVLPPSAAGLGPDAGRGVGLDAVRQAIEELSGSMAVDSAPGVGTRVRLELPVLGDLVALMIVEVAGHRLALRCSLLDGRPDGRLPAVPGPLGLPTSGETLLSLTDGRLLAVDRVIDEGEYLVAPPPFPLNGMSWLRGTGVAPEGHIFFVVEP
jgi:two-component system, chemotaxis family, sensor kinase CheA